MTRKKNKFSGIMKNSILQNRENEQNINETQDIDQLKDTYAIEDIIESEVLYDKEEYEKQYDNNESEDEEETQVLSESYIQEDIQDKQDNEVNKDTDEIHDTKSMNDTEETYAHDVIYAKKYGTTQGKKGHKLKRIQIGFSDENFDYLEDESREIGMFLYEYVNFLVSDYAQSYDRKNNLKSKTSEEIKCDYTKHRGAVGFVEDTYNFIKKESRWNQMRPSKFVNNIIDKIRKSKKMGA